MGKLTNRHLRTTESRIFFLLLLIAVCVCGTSALERARIGNILRLGDKALNSQLIERYMAETVRSKVVLPTCGRIPGNSVPTVKAPEYRSSGDVSEVDLYVSLLEDTKGTTMGLYTIPSTGGEFTRITYGPFAQNGGVYQDGYYFYSFADYYMGIKVYYSFLLNGNEKHWPTVNENPEQDDMRLCATAMANNPVTNEAYGCFFNAAGTEYELGIIDIHNFTRTTICKLDKGWSGAGFTADGTLYAILEDGNLATVDINDGTVSVIGDTGLPIEGPTSGTIDYRDGVFYYATNAAGNHAVYTINLETAVPTKLFDIPNEAVLGGMFIKYPNINSEAPAAVSDLSVNFDRSSLSGTVNFTAPSNTFGGEPLGCLLTYEISVNDVPAASGKCSASEKTVAPVSLSKAGMYTFVVTVSNEKGKSDEVKKSVWIGHDMPRAPQNVNLTMSGEDGLTVNLNWDEVSEGEHGGYIDLSDISYTVRRMPEGVVVADGLKTNSFTEVLENPTSVKSIYYEVAAVASGNVSSESSSESIKFGFITPPYSEGFDNANAFSTFTVVDANSDGCTWSFNYDKAQCKFNVDNDMDDWLISAPVRLKSGMIYDFSIDARAHSTMDTPERFEVFLGTDADVASMNRRILDPVDVTSKTYVRSTAQIIIPETGVYYIGIHGISPKDKYYLYIDNIAISEPYAGDTPGQASEFKVTPDPDGSLNATVSFRTPLKSTNDKALTDKLNVEVRRNDVVVHTFGGIEPGDICTFRDKAESIGEYTYTVQVSNKYGHGAIFAANAHLGVSLAPAAINPRIEEVSEGKARVSWESPSTDVFGNLLNPEAIRFCILDRTAQNVLAEGLKKNEFEIQMLEEGSGTQYFTFFYILTQTDAGVNYDDYVYTANIPLGTPYAYPFEESVKGGSLEKVWGVSRVKGGNATWATGAKSEQPEASSQDRDGGMAAFAPVEDGEEAMLVSGKIKIPAYASKPQLSFWYYGVKDEDDRLEVMAKDAGVEEWDKLADICIGDNGSGWRRVILDLVPYKGRMIQVAFNGVCVTHSTLILVDNIKIGDIYESNIGVSGITAPMRVEGGMKAAFKVDVENIGINAAKNITLKLRRDDEVVAEEKIMTMRADDRKSYQMTDIVPVFSSDRVVYTASIEWNEDGYADDNVSEPVTVKVTEPALPRVTDLYAEPDNAGVRLEWTEPSCDKAPGEILESFENAESFSVEALPGWKFVDRDGETTYGIEGVTFPHNGEPMAFIVIDNTWKGFSDFRINSGNKSLAAVSNDTGASNDDWAITPLLDGKPQTIRFSAAAYTSAYGYEAFECYYSTTDDNPDNFIKLGENRRVGMQWQEYAYDVPSGTKYFAIRCVSNNSFMLLIDDVMFSPASLSGEFPVEGYNIYRDGMGMNETVVAETSFVDMPDNTDNHEYVVTAVYPQGESAPSNKISAGSSHVSDLESDCPVVYVVGRNLTGSNVDGRRVSLMTVDGKNIWGTDDAVSGVLCIVDAGIYVASVDNMTFKLIVK